MVWGTVEISYTSEGTDPKVIIKIPVPVIAAQSDKERRTEALRQRGHLFAPGMRRLGEAVKQEDERALSFHHAVETDAVDPDVTLHATMLARPMPLAQACLATSPSASACSPDGSRLSSG